MDGREALRRLEAALFGKGGSSLLARFLHCHEPPLDKDNRADLDIRHDPLSTR